MNIGWRYDKIWREAEESSDWDKIIEMEQSADWSKEFQMPEIAATAPLLNALACLYAADSKRGAVFLRIALESADRLIKENRCQANDACKAGYPRNLGVIRRSRTFASWLLGDGLDHTALRTVAKNLTDWCLTKAIDHKKFNDSITMNFYLEGVRAAMISSDVAYAMKLLGTKHKFRWHHAKERDLWTRLLRAYPRVDEGLAEEFTSFFDRVRDPDFQELTDGKTPTYINKEVLALESGIIGQMYIVNDSLEAPVDPQAVIRAVSR